MSLSVPEIRQKLESNYHRNDWLHLLYDLFPQGDYYAEPETISLPSNELADKAFELGSITLDGGLPIGLFEIQLLPTVKLERNRVGLRSLLKQIMQQLPGALVVFAQGDKWRLSYVSQTLRKDENGQLVSTQTAPKRFTYLLGKGESALTAAQRFLHLHQRADANMFKQPSLADFEDAFNVEKLSKDFFRGYKEHYEKFLAHLQVEPAYRVTIFKAEGKATRDFTKKLLGRIVFLYFLQKKGWLGVPEGKKWGEGDFNFLQTLFQRTKNKDQFYSNILVELFFDTLNSGRPGYLAKNEITKAYGNTILIPYLNGGLFENDDPHTDRIAFPPKLFEDLFNFFGQYNFTVYEDSPDDHTVAVDPEMLGRIFESLLEEHRNKTGAFYTPKQVVHYMCRESLLQYLKTSSNSIDENKLQILINEHEAVDITKPEARHLDKLLQEVKICDPAIGSGAFPMGLLHEIFHARFALHTVINPNDEFDAAEAKKLIIERSIFGVDIETGAVDIAQLRFWLALVVDEPEPHELPNLDYKIITGNSLISRFQGKPLHLNWHVTFKGDALSGNSQEAELLQTKLHNSLLKLYNKQLQYFRYHGDKYKLQQEIRQLKIEILSSQVKLNRFEFQHQNREQGKIAFEEPEVPYGKDALRKLEIQNRLDEFDELLEQLNVLAKRPELPLNYFNWQLDFAYITNSEVAVDSPGFDIVIGNPPYVQLQKMDIKDKEELAQQGFQTFSKSADIYCLFYEIAITQLLKTGGALCFITSNSWLRTQYGEPLRKFFTQEANPLQLINLENTQMFQTAIVETNILLAQKSQWQHQLKAANLPPDYNTDIPLSAFLQPHWQTIPDLSNDGWIIGTSEELLLKKQMEDAGKILGKWDVEMNFGIKTGFNKAFIIPKPLHDALIEKEEKAKQLLQPLLRGKDVQKYISNFANQYLVNAHNGILVDKAAYNDNAIQHGEKEIFQWKGNKIEVYRKEEVGTKKLRINRVILEIDYPEVFNHMKNYEPELRKREDQGEHWTNLRSCDYIYDFQKSKIIWGEISDSAKFAYDEGGLMVNDRCSIIVGRNLKYLLAFLNSRAIGWYFNQISTSSGMGTNMWKQYKMEQFPIPVPDAETEQKVEQLVDFILYLKKPEHKALLHHTSNERIAITIEEVLNMMVFELYFKKHMVEKKIDVLQFVPVYEQNDIADSILRFYDWFQKHENPIRNRIILSGIVSKDIIVPIKQQTL